VKPQTYKAEVIITIDLETGRVGVAFHCIFITQAAISVKPNAEPSRATVTTTTNRRQLGPLRPPFITAGLPGLTGALLTTTS